MHTLDHTAYLITEENFSILSNIIENEWKPLGYTFCEPFTSTPANYTLSDAEHISYDSIIGKYIHASGKRLYFDDGNHVANRKHKNLIDNVNVLMKVE